MARLTDRRAGLFPQPREIEMSCSCPDYARLCKHVAAVLYGVGTRLDAAPELLFTLRDVDHLELITQAVAADNLSRTLGAEQDSALAGGDLGAIFGIELADENSANDRPPATSDQGTKGPGRKKPARGKKAAPVAAGPVSAGPVSAAPVSAAPVSPIPTSAMQATPPRFRRKSAAAAQPAPRKRAAVKKTRLQKSTTKPAAPVATTQKRTVPRAPRKQKAR